VELLFLGFVTAAKRFLIAGSGFSIVIKGPVQISEPALLICVIEL
jgi:hypothetical protein